MEQIRFIALLLAMGGMFYWIGTKTSSDTRHLDSEIKQLRTEIMDAMKRLQVSVDAIKKESQDLYEN